MANYLLEEWDIAPLPGSAFGEPAKSLRLRLSASLLCLPMHPGSLLERETALWEILSRAETLHSESGVVLSMPVLERAQARLAEIIQHLTYLSS